MSLAPSRLLRASEPPSSVSITHFSSFFFNPPPLFTTRRKCGSISSSSSSSIAKPSNVQEPYRRKNPNPNPNPNLRAQIDRRRRNAVDDEEGDLDFDGLQRFYELEHGRDGPYRSKRTVLSENRDSVPKGRFEEDPSSVDDQPWDYRVGDASSSMDELKESEDGRLSWTNNGDGNLRRKEDHRSFWQDGRGKNSIRDDRKNHQWEQGQRGRRTENPPPPPWFDGYGDINRNNSSSFQAERKHLSFRSGSSSTWQPERAFRSGTEMKPSLRHDREGNSSYDVNLRDGLQTGKNHSLEDSWSHPQTRNGSNSEELSMGYNETGEGLEESKYVTKPQSAITQIMDKLRTIKERNTVQEVVNKYPQSHMVESLDLPKASDYMKNMDISRTETIDPQKEAIRTKFPWEIEQDTESDIKTGRTARNLTLAELTIPEPELRRLRILSLHLKQRVKIGKNGVSKDLVNSIHERWRTCEVVKLKCEGPPAGNMKKTLETLEQKTGGLVIWKAGSVAVLYRGQNFGQPVAEIVDDLLTKKMQRISAANRQQMWPEVDQINAEDTPYSGTSNELNEPQTSKPKRLKPELHKIEEYTKEMNDILAELGPRYEEWTGAQPVPIDADLLPRIIPDYAPPFRVLPYGVRASLNNTVATHLRRISRPLPPHIVIGRDRDLHGLAATMVKLWEKSEIAKIGFKRGILNTNQERISEEIKQLTGGFLLCRDKYSATFFRGKDFLPQEIASALSERDAMSQALKDEERARADRSIMVQQSTGSHDVQPTWVHIMNPEEQIRLRREAARLRRAQVVNYLERKIQMALRRREKAGKELEKVEELLKPVNPPADKETITEEERFMFKKLGLRMPAFLLVGRRGVFSGVVQNMHLHWKHRELVKVIIKERDPVQLKQTARLLENESGGILVAVEKTSKGFAIIVYRGKNYARPSQLRPPNLLTKRLALKRHVEMQRRVSLERHIRALEEEIVYLRAGLSKMNNERVENNEIEVSDEVDADCGISTEEQKNHVGPLEQLSIIDTEDNDRDIDERDGIEASSFSEDDEEELSVEDDEMCSLKISKRKLRQLCEMGPVFRAERLSLSERHSFRNEVESMSKAAQYLVGKSNPLSKIADAIRMYFLDHAFVKIGVRGRPAGTSVQDIAEELEDLTGGTVYAQDVIKIIMYRGWPSGTKMPTSDIYNVLSPEQCDVLEEEEDEDDDEDEWSDDGENVEEIDHEINGKGQNYEDESWGILAEKEYQSDAEEADEEIETEVDSEANSETLDSDEEEWDIFGAEAQQRDYDVDAKIAELDLDEDV